MTQLDRLRAIAADPTRASLQERTPTAREIIEARLGRKLPPVPDMAPDERKAVKLLAIHLIRKRMGHL